MPKPLRSYNVFPIKAKNNAEKAFLGPQNVGLIGNITNLQGQSPTTLPQLHEGASGMLMAISQGLGPHFIESNGGRNFQALLNVQSEEVATCLGGDTEWFGKER